MPAIAEDGSIQNAHRSLAMQMSNGRLASNFRPIPAAAGNVRSFPTTEPSPEVARTTWGRQFPDIDFFHRLEDGTGV